MAGAKVGPRAASASVREELRQVLRGPRALTTLELSGLVGVSQKLLADHLEHLRRSLAAGPERLLVEPARCTACDFTFRTRERASRPSRCPACKSERIEPPKFRISGGPKG